MYQLPAKEWCQILSLKKTHSTHLWTNNIVQRHPPFNIENYAFHTFYIVTLQEAHFRAKVEAVLSSSGTGAEAQSDILTLM